MRGLDAETVREGFIYSDTDAEYAAVFEIDLDEIRPMVAAQRSPVTSTSLFRLPNSSSIKVPLVGSAVGEGRSSG